MTESSTVFIVHAVDTEGPLHESTAASFERIKDLFGVSHLEASEENLRRLKRAEIPLGGREDEIASVLSAHASTYNDTWDKIDTMLARITAPKFRNIFPDSFGGAWVYSWHYLDHVGFDPEHNPRRRDLGFHKVFDHYRNTLSSESLALDGAGWHFHPVSTNREAHRCATSYLRSSEFLEILCRKILERRWFPSTYRAGFQAERADSHWLLEQWIPFDLTNMSVEQGSETIATRDLAAGRSADWRRAPADWSIYNPSHDDYQIPGNCRRWIGRALNLLTRVANLDQTEVDKAFARAASGKPTVLGMASHDFRDIGTEVDFARSLVQQASKRFSNVQFKYCTTLNAFREALWPNGYDKKPLDFEVKFKPESAADVPSLEIVTTAGKVFGPQPFLAVETRKGRFFQDNLDFGLVPGQWSYAFHPDSICLNEVARVGIAANDEYGNTCIRTLEFEGGTFVVK